MELALKENDRFGGGLGISWQQWPFLEHGYFERDITIELV